MAEARWQRVLLKLSGEAFAGQAGYGIDGDVARTLAKEIVEVRRDLEVDVAIVVGGGNIWRGMSGAGGHGPRPGRLHGHARHRHQRAGAPGHPRAARPADPVMSAIHMAQVAEPYIRRRHPPPREGPRGDLRRGTGTRSSLPTPAPAGGRDRGGCAQGTHWHRRHYTADPKTNPDATKLDEVTYLDVLNQGLRAMDSTAISLCMDNDLPIVMFDLMGTGNVRAILEGGSIGTLVREAGQ
jgi:uridylate kinase